MTARRAYIVLAALAGLLVYKFLAERSGPRTASSGEERRPPGPHPAGPTPLWEGPLKHLAAAGGDAPFSVTAQLGDETGVYDHYQVGMELLESGNPAQAAVRLERARRGAPGKSSVREALGRAYFELNRLRDAESEFRAVVEIDPSNDYAHFCLSRVLQRRGRFKQASAHLKLAQAMSPDEERYWRWSGS